MKRSFWILLAVLAFATVLRFFQLDAQSFWNDEGTSARVAERSLPLITAAAIGDIHPPLYYYALHFWRGIFGESEFALRGLSAALGVVLVWLIYLLGSKLFDESTALLAASIAAINPFQVYYSQEARSYIMLAVWATASTYFLIQYKRQDSILSYASYVLTAAAGIYTHYAFPFVLVVHNLIAVVWLIVQRQGWRKWATWLGLQVAAVVLYLPWLSVALQRIPEWQSPAPAYQLGPALLDTFRWFVFGRTILTASVTVALGAVGLFLLVPFLPSRFTFHVSRSTLHSLHSALFLLAWWLIPIALIFALGLYKEAYLKFLLVCSPAFCLLFARGIMTAWHVARGSVSLARSWQVLVILLLILVAIFSIQSLSHLYFDPAYARDDYRSIARRIQHEARPGDAILLHAPNQWETFTYYHRDDSNVFPLARVRPVTEQAAADELSQITSRYKRLFVLYWAETEPDPQRFVERWLDANTYKVSETWYGTVRLAIYAVPVAQSNQPDHTLDVQFGDSIRLTGYSLAGESAAPGDIVQLALFWKTAAPIAARYKVFVHVLGADGSILTQVDREPGGGLVPTTIWQPGQIVIDHYGIPIPSNTAPGRYRIVIGLYGFDNVRLNTPNGDRVILTEVTIQ
jgi:4-amino-4-deoxy-L-arabinose transferase-like glycosyltransferase